MSASETLPAEKEVARTVDHLFRRESGRLVAILARRLGAAHLHLAGDVVQDALLRAMEVWPFTGIPENPSAWLLQTARNRAFDSMRRDRLLAEKAPALANLIEDCARDALVAPPPQFEDEIADSQLRMMFVCCQPALPADTQVALILKTLCGFGEREIAAAFLSSEEALAKKLVRARKLLRDSRIAVELPAPVVLAERVDTVLQALYLLFAEGHKASAGDALLRAELCDEAIRLGELLAGRPLADRPETHALLALFHLHASRLPSRVTDDGSLLVLAEQDRSRWDCAHRARGLCHLEKSASGDRLTRWHLEAGIAACHALAPSYGQTNWPRILGLYDELMAIDSSPIVALNRAVALSRVFGTDAGREALEKISRRKELENYYLFHAVTGQFLFEDGQLAEAAEALALAVAFAPQAAERELLGRRLAVARSLPGGRARRDSGLAAGR